MLFQLKDTTVEEISPHDQDGEYVDSGLCPTCWGSVFTKVYMMMFNSKQHSLPMRNCISFVDLLWLV